jgi:hypothetical protein
MPPKAKRKTRLPRLELDIRGIGPGTHLSELTVEQFTQLLWQVLDQIAMARLNPAKTQTVLAEIQKLIAARQPTDAPSILNVVREAQEVVLDNIPRLRARIR